MSLSSGEDQADGAIPAFRAQEALDRRGEVPLRGMPLRGGDEELRFRAYVGRPQAVSQQITEEVVEPVAIGPARHRDHEHGVVLKLTQERRTVIDPGDVLDEARADLLEHREAEQGAVRRFGVCASSTSSLR